MALVADFSFLDNGGANLGIDTSAQLAQNVEPCGLLEDAAFELPNVPNPASFVQYHRGSKDAPGLMDFKKGTTTLGMVFKGGVLLCVDSRASMGPFIGSQSVRKVIEINDYLLGTMAGGAADCLFWERNLATQCRMHELRNKDRISVAAASKLLANQTYSYRGYGLSMGTMIAGWDKTGPNLYYVDDDGTRLKGNMFSVGSGSTYAYGVLDTGYRFDMELDEAVDLGKRAIYHATHRDAYSGGVCRVYHIHKDGWTIIEDAKDVTELHYEYAAQKGSNGIDD
eukprot:GILJ01000866.1.p1 GENE.GILJ01000866.1~~GILJ01000866.1.p1  ORF type:complete len:297 (-),score=53.47 GILJ01000866.1:122-967(-)